MNRDSRRFVWLFLFGSLVASPALALFQEPESPPLEIAWIEGPSSGDLGGVARVQVPEGYVFAGSEDTRKLMELMQNPLSNQEVGFLAPDEKDWFIVFEFDPIGYVKDDEKEALDADAILESLRSGNRQANEIRKENGWETLEIVGWQRPPYYNPQTHNLEWATLARTEAGESVINYNTRILGRNGVMSATLVSSPDQLESILPVSASLLSGYDYLPGSRYAEFRAGDKIAEYGLTALITGGAAAVALKTGLLQKFGKFIVLAFVAVIGFFKRILGSLFGRKSEEGVSYE